MKFVTLYRPLAQHIIYGLDRQRDIYLSAYLHSQAIKHLVERREDHEAFNPFNPEHLINYEDTVEEAMEIMLLKMEHVEAEDALRAAEIKAAPPPGDEFWVGQRADLDRHYPTVNLYNKQIIASSFADPATLELKGNSASEAPYYAQLQASRYAPQKVGGASEKSLKKGDGEADVGGLSPGALSDLRGLLAIRRACKFGIAHILKVGSVVHYVLDEIDIDAVVNKSTYPIYSGKNGVPITTSELRFMFRQWHHLKNQAGLRFYRGLETCPAPWLSTPDKWLPYAVHLVEKFQTKPVAGPFASQIADFNRERIIPGRGAQALAHFFLLPIKDQLIA